MSLLTTKLPDKDFRRLADKLQICENRCWEWTGSRSKKGYGQGYRRIDGKPKALTVHRAFFEHFRGPIPAGLQLDHLCRNPACCNPAHLEPVTNRENSLRGESPTAKTWRTGVCKRGHPIAGANLLPSGRFHVCRTCAYEGMRRRYREKLAKEGRSITYANRKTKTLIT